MSMVVDNFAGGGGASTGIESALGRPCDIAINHDPEAIAMHAANHPQTKHLVGSVWDYAPRAITRGRSVDLGWFSPDCTFHSKARGGKPFRDRNVARRRRGLAWLVTRWAKEVRPKVIMLENVEEFASWGPLLPDGRICPKRRGQTFRRWHRQLENLGYSIDMRELRACDYGAPTTRKRLFVIARSDDGEIMFPRATHGPWDGAAPYRTAAECIDWSIPCPSIFERKRPLAEATMRRIARGVMRYVVNNSEPFIVSMRGTSDAHLHGDSIREPLRTVSAGGTHHALVAAFLARHYGGHENDGAPLSIPMHTITTKDHHALVSAFLIAYYGNDKEGGSLRDPMRTIVTKDRFGLVTIKGQDYRIVDIGMRMLTPRELFRAQSFPESYVIDPVVDGKPLPKVAQVRMVGNSVAPAVAEALVRANCIEQRDLFANVEDA